MVGPRRLVKLPGILWGLHRIFRERQTDIIHLHQLQADQITFAVARAMGGPPYVSTFHGRDVRDCKHRSRVERWAIRHIVRRASGLTAVSQELAALAESEIPGAKNVQVKRNGIDLSGVRAAGTAPNGAPAKYFLAVGRLYPLDKFSVKGQDLLIRAWSKLRLAKPDLHLLLAGADDERRGYEMFADAREVNKQVHILGSLPRPQLLAVMSGAIGVVTASRSEGGGLTMPILESGSFARPLVARNIPAHSECLQIGVDCLLVLPEDPESIAGAVARLADDPALAARPGDALQKKIRALSSAERMCEEYVRSADTQALERRPTRHS